MEKYWKSWERKLIKGMCWVYWVISWVCKHFSLWLYHLCLLIRVYEIWDFLVAQSVKTLPAMQETWVQFLDWENLLEKKNGNPLQYSCLGNPRDRGAWWAPVYGAHPQTQVLAAAAVLVASLMSGFLHFPCGLQLVRLLCPWNSLGNSTRVGCHSLLQGIFLTQGSNPCLLYCS